MLLHHESGEPFATGAAPYAYQPASEHENTPRIIISIEIQRIRTTAFVDTGGVYALFPPEIAEQLNIDRDRGAPADPLLWRGVKLDGALHRIPITLLAERGKSLTIEATVFVPEPASWHQQIIDFPCVLGMYLCFDRLRFAIDPTNDVIYFGG